MSGIAVIYNRDGHPVNCELLSRMIEAVPYRGPDGIHVWADGPVGIGHAMMHATPESLHEAQPLWDREAGLVLTMDGRVDNREEIAAALKAKGFRLRDDTDAELVLRAYECWGEDSPGKIVGDFAYAIWDARRRHLFCARDPLGVKAFYFYADAHTFLAASELHQILECSFVSRQPNEGMIAEYLSADLRNREETFFSNIRRLPPAHMMVVDLSHLSTRRYYDLLSTPEVRHSTDQEYSDHFREIFRESVRCRLRTIGPVAVTLSGGLDSSSIAAMAQQLCREGSVTVPSLEAFSMYFSEPDADERSYIQEVVRLCDFSSHAVGPLVPDEALCLEEVRRYKEVPNFPNGCMEYPMMQLERNRNCRVTLDGAGGDEWLTGSSLYYADLLRQFRIGELLTAVRSKSHLMELEIRPTVNSLWILVHKVIRPFAARTLPGFARRLLRRAVGCRNFPSWIDPLFAKRTALQDRLDRTYGRSRTVNFAQQDPLDVFESGELAYGNELGDRCASWHGLEQRSPFFDRRMMEFGFGIPETQRRRNGQAKYVLCNAVRGLIPEMVRQRRTKGEFSHVFGEALRTLSSADCSRFSLLSSMGWIDPDSVRLAWQHTLELYNRRDPRYIGRNLWALWMACATEMWSKEMHLSG